MSPVVKTRRFWWKLAISYFLFALGSLSLAGLYLAIVFVPRARIQGEEFIHRRTEKFARLFALSLSSGDGKLEISQALDVFSAPHDPLIWILNERGEILFASRKARESALSPDGAVVADAVKGESRRGVMKREKLYYYAAPLVYEGKMMGCLYLCIPLASIGTGGWETLLPLLQAFFLIALLSLLAALGMARKITRPLEEMTDTAREIGEGNLSMRVSEISYSEEIKVLGETLNGMASKLSGTIESLEEEKEQLRLMEKRRRELVASISHEIRTPLATIQGCAESLHDGVVSGQDAVHYTEVISREVVRLDRLMKDLLELSRLEAGAVSLEKESFSSHALFREIITSKMPEMSKVPVTASIGGDDAALYADRGRITQVLLNLVENTIRYCPGGTRITISAAGHDGNVEVTYEDDGPGVPSEDLPRLFEHFFRVEKSRSRSQGGCGLGLAIARNLVALHGGTITALPVEPHGLRFVITLPGSC